MMQVDREKLACSLSRILCAEADKKVEKCGVQYDTVSPFTIYHLPENFKIPPISFGAEEIAVPITSKDILRIQNEAKEQASHDVKNNFNNPARLKLQVLNPHSYEKALQNVGITTLNTHAGFKVVDEVELHIVLKHFSLCLPGHPFSIEEESFKKPVGYIGKLILQLPIAGQISGGSLVGKDREVMSILPPPPGKWTCIIVLSGCSYEWTLHEKGFIVALDFDLIWRPSTPSIKPDVSSFVRIIHDFQKIKNSLNAWNYFNEDVTITPTKSKQEKLLSSFLALSNAQLSDLYTTRQIFVFPLAGNYSESSLCSKALYGVDSRLVHTLMYINHVDLQLAIISPTSNRNSSSVDRNSNSEEQDVSCSPLSSFGIDSWIYLENSVPQVDEKVEIDFSTHFLGEINTVLQSDAGEKRYPVLVIQPRIQSIFRCARHNFDTLLHHCDSTVRLIGDSKLARRLRCSKYFQEILYFCEKEPWVVWGAVPCSLAEERTIRMLNICPKLYFLKDSGCLQLLRLLGQVHNSKYPDSIDTKEVQKEFYVGIQSESVARAIADVVWCVPDDWASIASPILDLINSNGLVKQLKHFCSLARYLIDGNLDSGAISVVRQIRKTMCSNVELLGLLEQSSIDSYIDTLIVVTGKDSVQDLSDELFPVFVRLGHRQQYRILIKFENHPSFGLEVEPSCTLYGKMAKHVLDSGDIEFSEGNEDAAKDLVVSLLQHGDNRLTEALINRVFLPNNPLGSNWEFINWFIVTAVNLGTSSLLASSVQSRVISLRKSLHSAMKDSLTQLLHCLYIVGSMEQHHEFVDLSSELKSFAPFYRNTSFHELISIVFGLVHQSPVPLETSIFIRNELKTIGSALFNQECPTSIGKEPFIDLLGFYLQQHELSCAKQFLSSVCNVEKWSPYHKADLIRTVLSTPEVWGHIMKKKNGAEFVCDSISKLTKAWISVICDLIDCSGVQDTVEESSYVRTSIAACFLLYAKYPGIFPAQSNLDLFTSLLEKMSVNQLGSLILDLFHSGKSSSLHLKLCQQFVSLDLKTWMSNAENLDLISFTKCLLVLEDDSLIEAYCNQIVDAFPGHKRNEVMQIIAQSSEIQEITNSTPWARRAICQLYERRLEILVSMLDRKGADSSSWRMTQLQFPKYPNVESFLHSDENMTYVNFCSKEEAHSCKSELSSLCSVYGFALKIDVVGRKYNAKCKIEKTKPVVTGQLAEEKSILETYIYQLKFNPSETDRCRKTPLKEEPIPYSSPAKKAKIDRDIIEIDD